MHSFFTITHYNAGHDFGRKKPQSVAGKEQPHTCKEKNITLKKHQHRIIKLTQNAFFFTLTHYNTSHDCGRKMHQPVTGKGPSHTSKDKKTTIKKKQAK